MAQRKKSTATNPHGVISNKLRKNANNAFGKILEAQKDIAEAQKDLDAGIKQLREELLNATFTYGT